MIVKNDRVDVMTSLTAEERDRAVHLCRAVSGYVYSNQDAYDLEAVAVRGEAVVVFRSNISDACD